MLLGPQTLPPHLLIPYCGERGQGMDACLGSLAKWGLCQRVLPESQGSSWLPEVLPWPVQVEASVAEGPGGGPSHSLLGPACLPMRLSRLCL